MLEKIIEYQNIEAEVVSAENELAKSPDREKASEIQQVLKNQHARLIALEKSAEKINKAYDLATKKYQEYVKKLDELEKELENADGAKLAVYEKAYKDFYAISNSLEKEITAMYTEVQQVSHEYEEIIKKSKSDRARFDKFKASYSKLKQEKEPKIEELKKKLASMKKEVDDKLMQKYMQKREGRIFPVFVMLNGTKCGGCRMEISASKLGAMNSNDYGVIECENCGRYIYKK